MGDQPRYEAYEASDFFPDGAAMRPLPAHTVARGQLQADEIFFTGMRNGKLVAGIPGQITTAMIERGRERFNIHCAVCHGLGAGDGMIVRAVSHAALLSQRPPARRAGRPLLRRDDPWIRRDAYASWSRRGPLAIVATCGRFKPARMLRWMSPPPSEASWKRRSRHEFGKHKTPAHGDMGDRRTHRSVRDRRVVRSEGVY
jgi:hypothetical protein